MSHFVRAARLRLDSWHLTCRRGKLERHKEMLGISESCMHLFKQM